MDTDTAIATFEILNNEDRLVVAGLIPALRATLAPADKEKYVSKSGRAVDTESPFFEDYDVIEPPKKNFK